MPPLTQKLGILFGPFEGKYAEGLAREHRLTDELIEQLPAGAVVRQHFHENFRSWLPFYWRSFQQTTRYTYILPALADLDAVWNGMRNTLRTEIRKGQKRGFRVRETDDVERFYQINAKTFERKGLKIAHALELVRRIDEACVKNAGRRIFIAESPDGRPVAGSYLVYDADCAVYLLGGLDAKAAGSGAKALVDWEMIRFAATVSRSFDLEGSMIPSVERYFREFGATQVPYSRIWGRAGSPGHWSLTSRFRNWAGRALRRIVRAVDESLVP